MGAINNAGAQGHEKKSGLVTGGVLCKDGGIVKSGGISDIYAHLKATPAKAVGFFVVVFCASLRL